jgi:phosphoglycolate phosphatase-like HAD superfamily hydrolase
VAAMGANVPPFSRVRECLARMGELADVGVVSSTPQTTLDEEWREHKLSEFVRVVIGQEQGTKRETLSLSQRYPAAMRLMIGDAPGDQAAAEANECLFFPINPGHEEESWRRLEVEGLNRFFVGTFAGEYQNQLLDEFHRLLPAKPPWLGD